MDKSKIIARIKSAIDNQHYIDFNVKNSISRLAKKNNILIIAFIHSGIIIIDGISSKTFTAVNRVDDLDEQDQRFILIQNHDNNSIDMHRFSDDIYYNKHRFSYDIEACLEFKLSLEKEEGHVYRLDLIDHYEYNISYESFIIKGEKWNGDHCNGFIIDMDFIKKPEIDMYHLLFNIRYILGNYRRGESNLNCKMDESNSIYFNIKVNTFLGDTLFSIKIGKINGELCIGVKKHSQPYSFILKNIKSIDCIFNIIFGLMYYASVEDLKDLNFKINTEEEQDWI